MTTLGKQLSVALQPGMHVPGPLEALYKWIESRSLYVDRRGKRFGFLYPKEDMKSNWTEEARPGGTIIEFATDNSSSLKYWFGLNNPNVKSALKRLCVFAQTGDDGSMAALWLDDDGKQKIVHLGSGSGSTLVCVLADDAVDFIRLLAVGYDEICWGENFSNLPSVVAKRNGFNVLPNLEFQRWVRETFSVSIPRSASKIVKTPSVMEVKRSADPFWNWVKKITK